MGHAARRRREQEQAAARPDPVPPPPPIVVPREVTLTLTWEDVEALYLIVGDRLKLLDLEQHLSPQMLVAPKRAGMSLLQVKLNAALAAALEKAAAKPGAPAPA